MRPGARIADVGTDHAHLPIYLCETGLVSGGVVSDINRGPIERAKANIHAAGLSARLSAVLCDGLSDLEPYAPTDILILGMGGELIARILSEADWICREGIRLILQPMTHPEEVRAFLFAKGFLVTEEKIVKEEKLYQIIVAEYTGVCTAATAAELLLGPQNLERGGELLCELCERYLAVFAERKRGKLCAGLDISEEEAMIDLLSDIKNNGGKRNDRS